MKLSIFFLLPDIMAVEFGTIAEEDIMDHYKYCAVFENSGEVFECNSFKQLYRNVMLNLTYGGDHAEKVFFNRLEGGVFEGLFYGLEKWKSGHRWIITLHYYDREFDLRSMAIEEI